MHPLEKFQYCPRCGSPHFEKDSVKSRHCLDCGLEYFMNASSANVALILNGRGELLVERRKKAPAQGMLDLPGGFADIGETAEEGVCREVKEETGMTVTRADYLFSLPNRYEYSGIIIPTLDLFFLCTVEDTSMLAAADDAAEVMWIPCDEIRPELFGLDSVRQGVMRFVRDRTSRCPSGRNT